MADIFVSYARADKERVAPLVAALAAQGWSVWWDPEITPGQEFDRLINAELRAAKAVIVVWTPASVESRWVRGEARVSAERGVLVPVRFDNASLPLDALAMHTTDLDDWNANTSHAGFQGLVRALRTLIARTEQAAPQPTSSMPQAQAPQAALSPMQTTANAAQITRFWFGLSSRQLIAALAIILGTALAITGTIVRHGAPPHHSRSNQTAPSAAAQGAAATVATPAKPRLAVMPFENLSPDPANAFFTDGMHEEILTALANAAPGLEVISRTTMDSYKGKPVTVEQIAKDLGATHVIEGSVRREGDEVRLTLQLIDAKTDQHLWAQDYDRTLTNALTLQTEVADAVAKQLSVQLGAALLQSAAQSATDPAAYDLYLKARAARQQLAGWAPISAWLGIKAQLDRAIALDPKFAPAYVERMNVDWFLFADNYDASDERYALARADLDAAERLAPDSPAVLAAAGQLAFAVDDLPQVLPRFAAAEAAGFADPDILQWKAAALADLGRYDEALALLERLAKLDPKNQQLLSVWWQACVSARKPAEALHVTDLALASTPNDLGAFTFFRANTVFWFTGRLPGPPPATQADPADSFVNAMIQNQFDGMVAAAFDILRLYAHDNRSARKMMDGARSRASIESIRTPGPVLFPPIGLGRTPISELRGQADLLLADEAQLKKDGQDVLDFVARQKPTKWNPWFVHMLRAEGLLFAGDKVGAVAGAREAIALQPASSARAFKALARYKAAFIYAWAGETDAAAAILENFATETPGLPPAQIAREPLFTVPLASNARFRALKAKLEAQMAANAKELGAQ